MTLGVKKNKKIFNRFIFVLLMIILLISLSQISFAYNITPFGTTGAWPYSITIDSTGNIYTANYFSSNVSKITPLGVSTILGGVVGLHPTDITIDPAGNIYTADYDTNNVTKITPLGVSTSFGNTGTDPWGITIDPAGNIYTANSGSDNVSKITPLGVSTIIGTTGSFPMGITIDPAGNIYTANAGSNNVSKITPLGVSTILGATGTTPRDITIDSIGNIYTVNQDSTNVSKITPAGVSTILGSTGGDPLGITIDPAGNIYTTNSSSDNVSKITPLGVSTIIGTTGDSPYGILIDSVGDIYVSNLGSNNVSKITNPTITEVTVVPTPISIGDPLNYTFNSNSAGTITYGGSCNSVTGVAIAGDNTITFDPLIPNTYNDCTITVTDGFGPSNVLPVSLFTVISLPATITTDVATSIDRNAALLNGTISNTGGENPTTLFQYGKTIAYGTSTPVTVPLGVGSFAKGISGLSCETLYHYKAFATNSGGVVDGGDRTFITNPCPGSTGGSGGSGGDNPPPPPPPPPTCEELGNCPLPPEPTCEELGTCPLPPEPTCEELGNCPLPPEPTCEELGTCPFPPEEPGDEMPVENNSFFENINSPIQDFLNNNFTPEIIQKVDVGLKVTAIGSAVIGGTVSLASILFLNPLATPELILIPFRLWSLFLTALGLKRRIKPWGTVYDSITKQPLDPVYVSLVNLEGKEIASSITDLDGRYGFYVEAGVYKVIPKKTNYVFPSHALAEHLQDEFYRDLYFGDYINVAAGQIIVNNIPMDPVNFDWNEFAKNKKQLFKFYSKKELIISRISNILFGIGFFVALVALIVSPEIFNIIIFGLYVLMFILRRTKFKLRAKGRIIDADGSPLSFGFIRVFSVATNVEMIHKVIDKMGRYYIILPNGKYYVKIEKKNDDGTYSLVHTSEPIEIKHGTLNKVFNV